MFHVIDFHTKRTPDKDYVDSGCAYNLLEISDTGWIDRITLLKLNNSAVYTVTINDQMVKLGDWDVCKEFIEQKSIEGVNIPPF